MDFSAFKKGIELGIEKATEILDELKDGKALSVIEVLNAGKEAVEAANIEEEDSGYKELGALFGVSAYVVQQLEEQLDEDSKFRSAIPSSVLSVLGTFSNAAALGDALAKEDGYAALEASVNLAESALATIAYATGGALVWVDAAVAVLQVVSIGLQYGPKIASYLENLVATPETVRATGVLANDLNVSVTTETGPLLFSLTGSSNGIQTIGLNAPDAENYFDYGDTGYAVKTGWAGPNSGVLVTDPFNTGTVSSESQVVTSFQQLQHLAGSGTVNITRDNPIWNTLKIWVNGNGEPGTGQLYSLDALGIQSISLQYTSLNFGPSSSGAVETAVTTVTLSDGSTSDLGSFTFQTSPTDTQPTFAPAVSTAIKNLPAITACGNVADLTDAMAENSALATMVSNFSNVTSLNDAEALLTNILYSWTGANQVTDTLLQKVANIDSRQLYVIEQFRGEPYNSDDVILTSPDKFADLYDEVYTFVFAALVAQGPLKSLWNNTSFTVNDASSFNPVTDINWTIIDSTYDTWVTAGLGVAANNLAMLAEAVNGLNLTSVDSAKQLWDGFKDYVTGKQPDFGDILNYYDGTSSAEVGLGTTSQSTLTSTDAGGYLFGFSGQDLFKSNGGNTLEDFGSGGNDAYEVSNADVIKDSTGSGSVWFNGEKLTGGQWNSTTNQFESPDFTYQVVNGNSLLVKSVADPSQSITIDNIPLTQNSDGSYSITGGTYLGINLTEPEPNVPTYDISTTAGYTQTWVQGFVHSVDYGVFGPPSGYYIIDPQAGEYNLVFDDLNESDIYVQEVNLGVYSTGGAYAPGYDYDIYLANPTQNYPNGGQLLVRLVDEADPSGDAPILNTITFADGSVVTLGQLLQMPQIGLPTDPTVSVDGSESAIAQAGINATYQVGMLSKNVALTGFSSSSTSSDQLSFTSAVSPGNLTFSQSGDDLLVTNLSTGAVLQVDNYLGPDTDPSVARSIQFADGTSLSYTDLVAEIENGTSPTINTGADLLQLTTTGENADGTYSVDLSAAEAYIDNLIATNDPTASTVLAQFAQALQPLENAGLVNYQAFREHYVGDGQQYAWVLDTGEVTAPSSEYQYRVEYGEQGGGLLISGNVWMDAANFSAIVTHPYSLTLYGNSGHEVMTDDNPDQSLSLTVVGGSGSITYNASVTGGTDVFDGGTGDNVFTGGTGTNFFSAHGGNDVDNGGEGANTYFLSAGFGSVVINNMGHNYQTLGNDVIEFDSSLTEDDVSFTQEGTDLLVTDDYGDQALVLGYYAQPDSYGNVQTVGTIKFSDGVTLSPSDMDYWADTSTQTDANIVSAPDNDTGSTLVAWSTGATVVGGTGADALIGGAGNDTLIAGTGDDYMSGKEGTNTYVFGLNIGNDVIDTAAALGIGTNIIQFVDGITASQLSFSQSGDNLVITVAGGSGSITVKQFFEDSVTEGPNALIYEIMFGDGSSWSTAQLFATLEVATNEHPEAWGFVSTATSGPQTGDLTSYVTATGDDVVLHGGDGYVNTIDAGSSKNATLYAAASNGASQLVNDIYTEGSNTKIYLGAESGGDTSDVVVFGTGNSDLFIPDNAGYVQVSNVTAGNNILHFADDVTFQQLMNVSLSWSASVQAGGTYLAMENNSDGNWSWYAPYYVSFANDSVSAVLADGHIFDTTFYRQWVDRDISVQYGSATAGQSETLVASDWGSAALFAGNGEEYLEASGNTAWMFGGSGDNFFYGNINGLYSGGSGHNYIYAGTGVSTIDGGLGTSDIYLNGNTNSSALIRVDLGGGNDTISLEQGSAVVQFGVGIASSGLTFIPDSNGDLVITVVSTGQTVTLQNWFELQTSPNLSLTFQDGSSLSYNSIEQMLPQSGASGDVTIWAEPDSTDLFAGSGNDVLNSSYYGNETIETGPGTDVVNLNGSGSHVITAGTGETTINNNAWGEGNSETLVINADSGSVVYNSGGSVPLTIEFGSGITESAVSAALMYDLASQMGNFEPTADLNLAIVGGPTIDMVSALQPYGAQADLPTLEFADGTTWTPEQLQEMFTVPLAGASEALVAAGTNTAITNGTAPTVSASDTQAFFSNTDSDIIFGSGVVQAIVANQGHSIIQANGGNANIVAYSRESWNYNSTSQSYTLTESPDLVDGGSGNSTITMTDGIALAQQGSSNVTLEGASVVLLFDAGDGADTVQNWSQNLTLSFGGGLSWNDVSLEQDGNDLVLDIGSSGKIDLQNYFQNPGANIQLQMFEGSDSSGVHAELANLSSIVTAFDAAGPQTSPWSIDNALTNLALTAETNQAYGGDVAAYYALNGTLGGLSTDVAQAVLKDPAFGTSQALTDPTQWQNGKYQLLAA